MMLCHLLKKDILIVKKYVLIMLVAAILIPPFVFWHAPEYRGVLGFILSVIFCVFMLLQYVSLKEYQFPQATTLLCATPFSRKMLVLSKYIFCMAIYAACCIIYGLETFVIPDLGAAQARLFVLMFLVVAVFIGLYLPIQYKLGYEKTKFAFAFIIMASPLICPQLLKMETLGFSCRLSTVSSLFFYGSILLFGLLVLSLSALLSMKLYSETDLA